MNGEFSPAPLIMDGTVYVGDSSGTAYALATDDGSKRWQTSAGEGIVAFTASGDSAVYARAKHSPMVALDTETGDEHWRFDAQGTTYCQPTFANGTVYGGGPNGTVYALDSRSGEQKWSFNTETKLVGVPAVIDETVYVTGEGITLLALDTESGSEKWRYRQGQAITAPPTVVGKRLFATDGDRVFAFHTETGDALWEQRVYQAGAFGVSVADDKVYVGGATEYDRPVNRLNALAIDDGTPIWQTDLPANPTTAPVVVDDAVLAGCEDGNLYAFDAVQSTQKWQVRVDGTEVFGPAIADGDIYVGSQHGVHALKSSSGSTPWMKIATFAGVGGLAGTIAYALRDRL